MSNGSTATNTEGFTKGEFTPLEDGDYLMRMNRVEVRPCKGGSMVSAGFQVVSGDAKGRLVFDNFLVEHTSAKAEEIGRERLGKYLEAIGVEGGLDGIAHEYTQLTDYLESPFIATLKTEGERTYTAKDGSTATAKASNKIKGFKKR